ncbi:hypothetical protein AVEN_82731-1 [Araneus ventricosus]|uniref:Uncharacterized protein n=1 Tax=Araneus ventricosus TaxID=182803 RepID=A0A4Y2H354_ARAVE|nr:hypothetical protein AVEN_82731-1 [Araneus ventricosus]
MLPKMQLVCGPDAHPTSTEGQNCPHGLIRKFEEWVAGACIVSILEHDGVVTESWVRCQRIKNKKLENQDPHATVYTSCMWIRCRLNQPPSKVLTW